MRTVIPCEREIMNEGENYSLFLLLKNCGNAIMECVTNSSFRLLWKGECTDTILQSRGIRQGDSISPYLFVLCLERLSQQIQKEVEDGHWKTLKASRHVPGISHLFRANDSL